MKRLIAVLATFGLALSLAAPATTFARSSSHGSSRARCDYRCLPAAGEAALVGFAKGDSTTVPTERVKDAEFSNGEATSRCD